MAKDQSNDITEQVGDTPETVVEKLKRCSQLHKSGKTGTALSLLAILIALGGWGWLLFWSATSS